MSFKCNNCGTEYENQVNFCRNCGSADFTENMIASDMQETVSLDYQESLEIQAKINQMNSDQQPQPIQQGGVQQPVQQYSQQPIQQPIPQQQFAQQPQPIPQQKRRGLAWWHILLIVLGGITVITLSVVPFVITATEIAKVEEENSKAYEDFENSVDDFNLDDFDLDDYTFPETETDDYSSYDDVEFEDTHGEVIGDYYYNEWAGFKFSMDGGAFDIDDEAYADYESSYIKDVLCVENYDLDNIAITVINTNLYPLTEEDLIDIYIDDYVEFLDEEGLEYDVTEYSTVNIAGKSYCYTGVELYAISHTYVCAREIGDYTIVIYIEGSDEEEVLEFIDDFKSY